MKIQLLIASEDKDYCQHLSQILAQDLEDTFDVSICSSKERLPAHHYDVGLFSPSMSLACDLSKVDLPLLLLDEAERTGEGDDSLEALRKYQRISRLAGEVMERYAKVAGRKRLPDSARARVCAVWSPVGGSGKTTVALAYAAQQVSAGRKVVYLDLEPFSSVSTYFAEGGKSISEAFEHLGGNLELLLQSIRQKDAGSGIHYFCAPSNYDDMNILTSSDLEELIGAAGHGMDEVVLDLSSTCDERCKSLLDMADRVLLVADRSKRSGEKLQQFIGQSNLFEQLRGKLTLVCNMGAQLKLPVEHTLWLDQIRSDNPVSVYKSLSAQDFNG